jgi:alpha-N-arabinofuranosidase
VDGFELYNYEDALAMSMFLNSFFRHANLVKMANLAQIVNVIAPMMTSKTGLYLQTIYFPIAEYAKQKGNQALDVLVNSPEYKPDGGHSLKYLDVSSTYDAGSHQVFLNVLNRSEKNDISAQVVSTAGTIAPAVGVWELNHADLKTTHTFGDDHKVRPTEKTADVALRDNGFGYTFPKHSLTILKIKVQ